MRVVLVDLPFHPIDRANLALALIASALRSCGLQASIIYPKLEFAQHLGHDGYRYIAERDPEHLLGELAFSHLTRIGRNNSHDLREILRAPCADSDFKRLCEIRALGL